MNIWANYKGFILNANRKINGEVLIWGTDENLKRFDFIEDLSVNPITYDKIVEKKWRIERCQRTILNRGR